MQVKNRKAQVDKTIKIVLWILVALIAMSALYKLIKYLTGA